MNAQNFSQKDLERLSKSISSGILGLTPRKNVVTLQPRMHIFRSAHPIPVCEGKSPLPSYETHSAVITHVSSDQAYLLRILKEKRSGNLETFLIHPEKNLYRFVFFRIEGIEQEFITDFQGRALIGRHDLDLSRAKIRISPPFAVFPADLTKSKEIHNIKPEFNATHRKNLAISVSLIEQERKQSLRVLVPRFHRQSSGSRVNLILNRKEVYSSLSHKGVALFEELDDSFPLKFQINLYE